MESSTWVFTMFSRNRKIEQEEGSLVSVTFDLIISFYFLVADLHSHAVCAFQPIDTCIYIYTYIYKLDDGWPESVEEQGLLMLVLRH